MQKAVAYFLLITMMLPIVSPWGTIAYYHLNKDYVARVLCENRDRPQLHCDGKCYLAKRLKAQQDKQDKKTTERVQQTASINLFCESHFSFDFTLFTALTHQQVFFYLLSSYSASFNGLLRPPCA